LPYRTAKFVKKGFKGGAKIDFQRKSIFAPPLNPFFDLIGLEVQSNQGIYDWGSVL